METICTLRVSLYTFAAVEEQDPERNKLLSSSMALFQRYGLKSVTMNDIAKELGISKKTLYKHVPNKAELIGACCMFSLTDVKENIRMMIGRSTNAIDELLLMDQFMRDKLETQLHIVEHQLRRHFPDEHQQLQEKRRQMILEVQRANLTRGIKEGIYREDIDIDIVAQLYYSKIHGLLTQSAHKPLIPNLKDLLGDAVVYHIHGIATPKGIEYLNERKSELGNPT